MMVKKKEEDNLIKSRKTYMQSTISSMRKVPNKDSMLKSYNGNIIPKTETMVMNIIYFF